MRELLQGRRLGFAPRALLASVAIGLGIGATLLDLMSWFAWGSRDTNGFVIGAYWLAIATAVVALLGLIAGVAELIDVAEEDRTLARLDLAAAGVAALLYAASAVLRAGDLGAAGASPAALLLAVGGLLLLLADSGVASVLYAAREWEEIEEVVRERHRRRHIASR
ncbi:MAG: hypothetical protein AABZ26_04910 [Chloroflexota bacterium]